MSIPRLAKVGDFFALVLLLHSASAVFRYEVTEGDADVKCAPTAVCEKNACIIFLATHLPFGILRPPSESVSKKQPGREKPQGFKPKGE